MSHLMHTPSEIYRFTLLKKIGIVTEEEFVNVRKDFNSYMATVLSFSY